MSAAVRRTLILLGLNLLIFLLARTGLWLIYAGDFHALTGTELLHAFGRGLRFDLSIVMLVAGGPLLMLLLPFRFAQHRLWAGFWTWSSLVLLAGFAFLLVADLVYFGFVHRHVGPEITTLSADPGLMLDMAISSYAWVLALYAAGCALLFWLGRRLFRLRESQPGRFLPRLAVFLLATVSTAALARGGIYNKAIDIVDAFAGSRPEAAYLSLNGPFAMAHSLKNSSAINAEFFPWPEAVARTRRAVLAPGEQPLAGDEYPLARVRSGSHHGRRPNVVVLMLESWDAAHVDATRRAMGLPPYGVTPNFDALAQQGQLFTRFYANGERSMDGLAALIAGIPTLPGTAYIGMGMEQNRMAYLGDMAKQEGYETVFLQSSKRSSFHVDSIAAMAGFSSYLGAEDIPATGHSTNTTERGAWDYDTFHEANRRFADARKPFVGFIFTASTHLPFQSPGDRWQKFVPDTLERRFLNSLYYADWALGEFFKEARQAGYYDNTIFILTADHVSGFAAKAGDVPSMHHVPLLVIAPGLKPGIVARTGGQVDVIPTLAELADWHTAQAGIGHSLLDARRDRIHGTFCVRGNVIERIEDGGWVAHDLRRRVAASADGRPEDIQGMEERLLAVYQVGHTLLLRNQIIPAAGEQPAL